jgi:hypothetical protein
VIVSDQLVTALATAAFPTFAVLIGILVNNRRLNDVARAVDVRFADMNRHLGDVNEMLRADMFRMKEHLQR